MENFALLRNFGSLSLFLAAGSVLFMLLKWKTRIPHKRVLLVLVLMLPALLRAQTAPPPGYKPCMLDANGVCTFSGPAELAYACQGLPTSPCPSGTYIFRRFPGPGITCTGATFRALSDPAGAPDNCYIPVNPTSGGPFGYNFCSNGGNCPVWGQPPCAQENTACFLGNLTNVDIAFGTNGRFVTRRINADPNSLHYTGWPCTKVTFFNVDPAPGVAKNCYISAFSNSIPYGYTKCADELSVCAITGPTRVAFGMNGNFVFSTFADATPCEAGYFNSVDPAPDTTKGCYIPTDPPGYAKCADENSVCSFNGTATVAFGTAGHFTFKTLANATACSDAVFGDPAFGVAKSCYIPAGPVGLQYCSSEHTACHLPNGGVVYYGYYGLFTGQTFAAQTLGVDVYCANSTFTIYNPFAAFFNLNNDIVFSGDPDPGAPKACFILRSAY
jgi:hypothetical protein